MYFNLLLFLVGMKKTFQARADVYVKNIVICIVQLPAAKSAIFYKINE
jgi:hypothetical protein